MLLLWYQLFRPDLSNNENVEGGPSDSQAAKKRVAILWLVVAILLVMPSVAHIFVVPFFLFGPPKAAVISPCLTAYITDPELNSTELFSNCTKQSQDGFTMDNTLLNDIHFFSDSIPEIQVRNMTKQNTKTIVLTMLLNAKILS